MTGPLNVDNDAISKAANDVLTAIEQMRGHINSVTATSQDMKSGWQGAAYAAFANVADTWQQEGIRLNQKIDAMNTALKEVITQTDAGEADSAGLITNSAPSAPSSSSLNMPH